MTRTNVEKLFKKHFNQTIPLSHESAADHWLPEFARYNVEVKQDVWENRALLVFDGNLQTSLQSMSNRLDNYHQEFKRKTLGERYLALWRSRWAPEGELEAWPFAKGRDAKPETVEIPSPAPKPRGRKRRAVLRSVRATSSKLVRKSI